MTEQQNLADALDEIGLSIAAAVASEPDLMVSVAIIKHGTITLLDDGLMSIVADGTGKEPTLEIWSLKPSLASRDESEGNSA